MNTPASPEFSRVLQSHIRQYTDLIRPFTGAPDTEHDRKGPNALLYDAIGQLLNLHGNWPKTVARGDFTSLNQFSERAAAKLTDRHTLTLPQAFAVHSLISLHATINHYDPFGQDVPHKDDRTSYFLTQFAGHFATRLPYETFQRAPQPHPVKLADILNRYNQQLAYRTGQPSVWLKTKLSIFASRVLRWAQLSENIGQEPPKQESLQALRQHNRTLLTKVRRQRQGIRSDGVYEGPEGRWSLYGPTYSLMLPGMVEEQNSETVQPGSWPVAIMSAARQLPRTSTDTDMVAFLGHSGEVFGDRHGSMPLQPAYEAAGKPANYEALRGFLLQRYIDMIDTRT